MGIPNFERYKAEVMRIRDNWDAIPDKVHVLFQLRPATTYHLTFKNRKEEKKEILGMFKVFHDLLEPEQKLVKARIEETQSIISQVIHEMAKLHRIKEMLRDDTEISDVKKKEILKEIAGINNDKDEEYQDLFGPTAFLILKQIPSIQDIVMANSEFPNDVKQWTLEKLSLLQQPENKVEQQPEQVPELSQELYKSLIRKLVDAESKKFDLCKNETEIRMVLTHVQNRIRSFEYHECAFSPAPPTPFRKPMANVPSFGLHRDEMMRIKDNWPSIPDKVEVLFPHHLLAIHFLGGEDMKGVMEIWKVFHDLLQTEEELVKARFDGTGCIISEAVYKIYRFRKRTQSLIRIFETRLRECAPSPAPFCKNDKVEGVLFSPAAAAAAGKKRDRVEEAESSTVMMKKSKYLSAGADPTGLP